MFQKKALIIRNMKVLSVILLGVSVLGIITFKSATSLPKVKTTPAPFNWQQFLPGGAASAERRATAGGDTGSASNEVYGAFPPYAAPNPMSPYLTLKPFLPVKPSLVPPFVDPNVFIGKKAELLGNLFGTGVGPAPAGTPSFIPPWISGGVITSPSFFTGKKETLLGTNINNPATDTSSSSLDSKRALTEDSEEESKIPVQPRLVVGGPSIWGPPAGVIPTPKPTIVPSGFWSPYPAGTPAPGSLPPMVDPSVMLDKKTKFLSELFNSLGTSGVSARAVVPDSAPGESTPKPTIFPPSYWLQFIPEFYTPPPPPTEKPTIVPPNFWVPSPATKPIGLFGPPVPVVNPAQMIDKKTAFLNALFSSLNISVTPEPVTTPAPTVDPVKAYQQQVEDFLDKLITEMKNRKIDETTASGVSKRAVVPDSAPAESTTKPSVLPPSIWLQYFPEFYTPSPPPTEKPTIVPPNFWVPSVVTKPVGLFGPPVPVVDPAQMINKKTAFLNALFSSFNISVTPEPVTTPAPTVDPVKAYQQQVEDFLDKLITEMKNTKTDETTAAKRALEAADKAKTAEDLKAFLGQIDVVQENAANLGKELDTRSAFERRNADDSNDTTTAPQLPVDALLTAKDKVVNTIIAEMGGIKNNILDTLAELLAKQKEAAATPPPTPAPKKKPGPPFGPGGPFGIGGPFGPWAGLAAAATTTPKPTPDPEPFQKKVEFLGQIFDTLTQMEKDITEALNKAVSEAAAVSATTAATTVATLTMPEPHSTNPPKQNNMTLFDLIRKKLVEIANSTEPNQQVVQQVPKYARAIVPFPGKPMGPPVPVPTVVDPSFWIPDTAAGVPVGPDYYMGKTQAFLSKLFASKAKTSTGEDDTAASKARSIKMAVHQGYQSLPPGSEELLQAGGGSTPQKHEGGGLKLQESATTAIPSFFQGGSNHRHHNHHNRD